MRIEMLCVELSGRMDNDMKMETWVSKSRTRW